MAMDVLRVVGAYPVGSYRYGRSANIDSTFMSFAAVSMDHCDQPAVQQRSCPKT